MILPCKCGKLAVWWYTTDEISDVFCDDCVPRGCGCNVLDKKTGEMERDEKGRLLPCCEWLKEPWGVPDGFEEDCQWHWGSSDEQDEDEAADHRRDANRSLAHVFDWNPPSEAIAATLNERGQAVCDHGLCPCFVFCGVQRHPSSGWEPISPQRRAEWFGRFFGLLFRNREKEYDRRFIRNDAK